MTMKSLVKKVLEKRGWTRYRLAKELGVSLQSIDYIMAQDPKGARIDTVLKLLELGKISAAELVRLLGEAEGEA